MPRKSSEIPVPNAAKKSLQSAGFSIFADKDFLNLATKRRRQTNGLTHGGSKLIRVYPVYLRPVYRSKQIALRQANKLNTPRVTIA